MTSSSISYIAFPGSRHNVGEIEKKLKDRWNFGGKENLENQKNKSPFPLRFQEGVFQMTEGVANFL
jgi:hypothetical protein